MPLYEYKCNECGENFEKMVRLSDTAMPQECPRCGCRDTSKQISQFAARLSSAAVSAGGSSGCATSSSPFR
jgi:putative FmdB family regulatory protein